MAINETIIKDLKNSLSRGVNELISAILDCIKRNEIVILVAVSRRMPHILLWYKLCRATPQEREILEQVEIVTEIALPFINLHSGNRKVNTFVIDDMVSTGRTIRYVSQLTQDITGIETIRVFIFFGNSNVKILSELGNNCHIFVSHYYSGKEEKRIIVDFLSSIIAHTLPIDVTYPLLYPGKNKDELNFDILKSLFKDSQSKEIDHYESVVEYQIPLDAKVDSATEEETANTSYTFLLPSEISGSLNNDFAKIRAYVRLGSIVVVPMAPNILSDSNLTNPELFENPEYRDIWKTALDAIDSEYLEKYDPFDPGAASKERIRNRCFRSLATFANYLYSLSSFNRITGQNENAKDWHFTLCPKDLDLIVGKTLASAICPQLQGILDRKIVSPRSHRRFNIGTTFIPDVYIKDYTLAKYICISHDSTEENLMAIFRNAREMNEECPALLTEDMEYDVEGIMESLEALENALFIKDYNRKVEINRWIDRKIDEGVIVSRYAYVANDNDKSNRYWRRFFRLTAMHD